MNVFDYFFNDTKQLNKNFILNEKDKVSYVNLYSNSLKVANFIHKTVGERQNIILVSHNSSFFVTVYLGILKSGNTCVPLNFTIEQANLDHIISLSGCNLAFTEKQLLQKLDFNGVNNICDQNLFSEILNSEDEFKVNINFDDERLAEIIFTSGTTGKPKGVMISHKNIRSNTDSIVSYLNLSSGDIMCVVLPFYYCYGLSLLHTHLRVGGSIVINNTFMFLSTVIKDLLSYKCTGFAGVPSHFQMLLKKSDTFKNTKFSFLRYVTQAGGKLPNHFIEEFVHSFPEKEFYVMYGQTEATARLTFLHPTKVLSKLGSIGKAIPNVQVKLVDKGGQEVQPGIEGELIAIGDNIMEGYYKDPELTNTILKNNWLYTGDLAKKDEDGDIFITARKKEIIKVGGNRVSPKEIEEIIVAVPNVIDCTIKGIPDDLQGEAIKAFVVLNDLKLEEIVKNEILKKCKEKLALYKSPQYFEFTDRLNIKSTGKKK